MQTAEFLKLDNDGNKLSVHQFGTPGDDYAYAVTADKKGNVYICGSTWGDFSGKNAGFIDGFVGKFSGNAILPYFFQFGSEGFDIAMNLAMDEDKNIYVGGTTSGNFESAQIGEGDAFLVKLGSDGKLLWKH